MRVLKLERVMTLSPGDYYLYNFEEFSPEVIEICNMQILLQRHIWFYILSFEG